MSKMHESSEPLNRLAFSTAELAERLGVSTRHIARLSAKGALPHPVRLGRSLRWSATEIGAWLLAGTPNRERWEQLKRNEGDVA